MRPVFKMMMLAWALSASGMVRGAEGDYLATLAPTPFVEADAARIVWPRTEAGQWTPSPEDTRLGFAAGYVGPGTPYRPDFVWDSPNGGPDSLVLQAARGETRLAVIALRALRDIDDPRVTFTKPTRPEGGDAAIENFAWHRVAYYGGEPRHKGLILLELLSPGLPTKINADTTVFLHLALPVPSDRAAGRYEGAVTIGAGGGTRTLRLSLEVLALDFAWPGRARGVFLPGMLYDPDRAVNWSPEFWTEENAERYFRFARERGVNSPWFYHVDPPLRMEDGELVGDWSEIGRLIQAARRAGLDGPALLDLRFSAGRARGASLDRFDDKGNPQCLFAKEAGGYSARARNLFQRLAERLVDVARREGWGELRLHVDEEFHGTPARKGALHDAFTPALRRGVGDAGLVVLDNPYNNLWSPLDRGARDHIASRVYSAWTREAMAAARADGATPQFYNHACSWRRWGGLFRAAFGNADYHVWADNWFSGSGPGTMYSLTTPAGVYSSPAFERQREGYADGFYAQEHERVEAALRAAGHAAEAEAMRALREAVIDLPSGEPFVAGDLALADDANLDARRARLIADIDQGRRRLGEEAIRAAAVTSKTSDAAEAAPTEAVVVARPYPLERPQRVIAFAVARPPVLDGEAESLWSGSGEDNALGGFVYPRLTIQRWRAKGQPEARIRARKPSATTARLLYDAEGLYLLATSADVGPDKTGPGWNGWMHYDDNVGFHFRPEATGPEYRLTVNAKDGHEWRRDLIALPSDGVRVASRAGEGGGLTQEIHLPWSAFGLNGPPAAGTRWLFNASRFFMPKDWDASTWVPVEDGRVLGHGGVLEFVDPEAAAASAPPEISAPPKLARAGDTLVFTCLRPGADVDSRVEAGGELIDAQGRRWPIPAFSLPGPRARVWLTLPRGLSGPQRLLWTLGGKKTETAFEVVE